MKPLETETTMIARTNEEILTDILPPLDSFKFDESTYDALKKVLELTTSEEGKKLSYEEWVQIWERLFDSFGMPS